MSAHPPAPVSRDAAMAAQRIAEDVLGFLERERIPPAPPVYRLFFEHATGSSATTSAAVERAIGDSERSGRPLAERIAEEVDEEAALDAWHEAAAMLAEQMAALDSRAEQAWAESRSYAGQLGAASQMLGQGGTSQASLRRLLRSLLGRHDALMQANSALRADLDRAQREIEATRAELATAAREAMRDPVTGLINRRGAEEELDAVVSSGAQFSLVMIDIDHFKTLNDGYGHQAGDLVLHEVGRALLAAVRAGDRAFRFGGDEFVAIIHAAGGEDIGAAAERLRRSVAEIDLARCVGGDIVGHLTISLGVARFRSADRVSTLLERADGALFAAKRAGRNRWAMAGD